MRQAVPHVGEGRDLLGQHVQGGFDLRRSGGERPGRESSEKKERRRRGDMPRKRGAQGGAGPGALSEAEPEGNFLDLRSSLYGDPIADATGAMTAKRLPRETGGRAGMPALTTVTRVVEALSGQRGKQFKK